MLDKSQPWLKVMTFMKSWLLFASGTILGIFIGAFCATFLLEVGQTPGSSLSPIAQAATKKKIALEEAAQLEKIQSTKAQTARKVQTPVVDERPKAVAAQPASVSAEAVDLDSLPVDESAPIMSTAKAEESPASDTEQ
jgi:hypothetical protein